MKELGKWPKMLNSHGKLQTHNIELENGRQYWYSPRRQQGGPFYVIFNFRQGHCTVRRDVFIEKNWNMYLRLQNFPFTYMKADKNETFAIWQRFPSQIGGFVTLAGLKSRGKCCFYLILRTKWGISKQEFRYLFGLVRKSHGVQNKPRYM